METGVQNSAGKTGGLAILPVKSRYTTARIKVTSNAKKFSCP